ncbi:hypothetical protein COB57_04500 [Candidatus Peregrinibacteria bacterium]|nr:MAG: hypothetical protein COB57_04500 [Candidatus Peregrinibacteria bacterium]
MYSEILEKVFLNNTIYQWGVSFGIFLGGTFLVWLFHKFISARLQLLSKKTDTKIDDILVDAFNTLVFRVGALFSLSFALNKLVIAPAVAGILQKIFLLLFTVVIIRILQVLLLQFLEMYFRNFSKDLTNSFLPFLRHFLSILLWLMGAGFVVSNFGYQISSLLAGLGIGGFAIALAIKPTLESFFSSIALFAGKPFEIGDVVKYGGYTGTIKNIGIRTTLMTTFDATEVIIPNIDLANSMIENISRRPSRRITGSIGLLYSTTAEEIQETIDVMYEIFAGHELLLDNAKVYFSEFADSALIISFSYCIQAKADYKTEVLPCISFVNLEIKKALESKNIGMAFPTQTLYIEKES